MGANTKITWATHTFNPWVGCTKVSPGCDNCYAESWAERYGVVKWGPKGERKRTSEANWKKPLMWNRQAEAAGRRDRVFCASLADIFDHKAPAGARDDLWRLIRDTPFLDWLVLTKRPQNFQKYLPHDWIGNYGNVWLGVTAENQRYAEERIPILLDTPAALRWVSAEPLIGPIDFRTLWVDMPNGGRALWDAIGDAGPIDWCITGGESGHEARPMNPEWVRDIRDQCVAAGIPFHHKQNGEWVSVSEIEGEGRHHRFDDGATVRRVGKVAAGRDIDGEVWDEFPIIGGAA